MADGRWKMADWMCKDVKSSRLLGVRIGSEWSGKVGKGADDEDEDEDDEEAEAEDEAEGDTKC